MARINVKQKGNRNESAICKILTEALGEPFSRTQSSGARVGGSNRQRHDQMEPEIKKSMASDVFCETKLNGAHFRFAIEAKAYKSAIILPALFKKDNQVQGWLNEVIADAKWAKSDPLLIFKYNGTKHFFAVPVDFANELPYLNNMIATQHMIIGFLDELLELTDKEWWWEQ